MIQVLLVVAQDDATRAALPEAQWCFIGVVATYPPRPHGCTGPNEIYGCAFGEARCDGHGFCGTPPCIWQYVKNIFNGS